MSPAVSARQSHAIKSNVVCGRFTATNCPASSRGYGLSLPPNRQRPLPHLQLFARNGCVLGNVSLFSLTRNRITSMAFLIRIPIHLYRWLISPFLHTLCGGIGCGCRFHPSCSAYALEALKVHGTIRGSLLSLRRITRCHPWCEGGLDPVPSSKTSALNSLTPAKLAPKKGLPLIIQLALPKGSFQP